MTDRAKVTAALAAAGERERWARREHDAALAHRDALIREACAAGVADDEVGRVVGLTPLRIRAIAGAEAGGR